MASPIVSAPRFQMASGTPYMYGMRHETSAPYLDRVTAPNWQITAPPSQHTKAPHLHRMTVRDVELAYTDTGKGESLVLVHANISDIRSWDAVVPLLANTFRVIAYSRRYAWPNEEIPENEGDPWEEHAEDLAAIIEQLKIGPAHVLGNSTGATIALLLAKKRPDLVNSLILEEPPLISLFLPNIPPSLTDIVSLLWYHPWSFLPTVVFGATVMGPTTNAFKKGDNDNALKIFSRGVLGSEFDQRLTNARREQMKNNTKPLRALLCHGKLPVFGEADVTEIKVPSLVLTGEMTVVSQRKINQRLALLLPGAQELKISGASHLMHEDQPGEVVRIVGEFVAATS